MRIIVSMALWCLLLPLAQAESSIERGRYIVEVIGACGNCHTPNTPDGGKDQAFHLAGPLGHCIECHSTPGAGGAPDLENSLGAGGMIFHGPWGTSAAANITPAGIGQKSDDEIRRIITTGIRADGSRLLPPMGISYYANLTDDDLDAIVAYLRSLPAK